MSLMYLITRLKTHGEFQSLFYWNTSDEVFIQPPRLSCLAFQSLFYWNTSDENGGPNTEQRDRRWGFNPCSIGIPLMRKEHKKRCVKDKSVSILVLLEYL